MKKEIFKEKLTEVLTEISDANIKKKELIRLYLEENAKYKIGDKLKVLNHRNEEKKVFVKKIILDYNSNLQYTFYKSKKDGTQSKQEEYYYRLKIIGLCE